MASKTSDGKPRAEATSTDLEEPAEHFGDNSVGSAVSSSQLNYL